MSLAIEMKTFTGESGLFRKATPHKLRQMQILKMGVPAISPTGLCLFFFNIFLTINFLGSAVAQW